MEDFVLKEAKQGNEFAFARIVETYEKRIYQLCYRMLGSPEDAADQTQETFLKAWRGLSAFQGDCSIGTWLYRLAANCCIDHLRREKKHRTYLKQWDSGEDNQPPPLPADPSSDPQEKLEQKERHDAVWSAMKRLTPEHRMILILRETQGLSYGEIADVLKLEEGTVKSRIARARIQLRNILKNQGTFLH